MSVKKKAVTARKSTAKAKKSAITFASIPVFKNEPEPEEQPSPVEPSDDCDEPITPEEDVEVEANPGDVPTISYGIYKAPLGTKEDGYRLLIGLGIVLVVLFFLLGLLSMLTGTCDEATAPDTYELCVPELEYNSDSKVYRLDVSELDSFQIAHITAYGDLEFRDAEGSDGFLEFDRNYLQNGPTLLIGRQGNTIMVGRITPISSVTYPELSQLIRRSVLMISDPLASTYMPQLYDTFLQASDMQGTVEERLNAVKEVNRHILGFDNPDHAASFEAGWYAILGNDGIIDKWLKSKNITITDENVEGIFLSIAEGFKQ